MNYKTDWAIINDLISEFEQYIKGKYNQTPEIELCSFPQTWGSTAQTIVLYDVYQGVVRVYFGGNRLAYQIENPNQLFFEDLSRWQLKEVSRAGAYRRKDTDIYGNIINK